MLKIQSANNISTEWKDIKYYDICKNKELITITKGEFENMVNDTFEAVQTNEFGDITTIWTKKYVFNVRAIKVDMTTDILTGYLRKW